MCNMILMHQNSVVANLEIKDNKIQNYKEIYNASLLPVGTYHENSLTQKILLDSWIKSRCIPNGRPNMDKIYKKIGMSNGELFFQNSGISLTDCYWIKDKESNLKWEDVNFHDNGFHPMIANLLLGIDKGFKKSPDFTTDGMLFKFWINQLGKPFLIKFDDNYNLSVANEVFASKISEVLGINHVTYIYNKFKDLNASACPCFIKNNDEDFISALQLSHEKLGRTGELLYLYIKNTLGFSKEFNDMVFLDCLIENIDRHEKNFGIIKKSNNSMSFAPIFDSGTSLGCNYKSLNDIKEWELKTPKNKRKKEILSSLPSLYEVDFLIFNSILKETYEIFDVPEERYCIAQTVLKNGCELIEKEILNKNSNFYYDMEL